MRNLHSHAPTYTSSRRSQQFHIKAIAVAAVLLGACVDVADEADLEVGSISQNGLANGLANGFFRPEGLSQYLTTECPILKDRILSSGNLTQSFPSAFATEIAKPVCEKFMFYTVQLMVPKGQQVWLYVGNSKVASFTGVMGMQHLVRQVYPSYTFVQHAFLPAYPIARKVATQGYAALANEISRTVSFRTNVPELDAHRASSENNWPREFLMLVPFTAAGLSAMVSNPSFLARQPDFFNACDTTKISYENLKSGTSLPPGACSVPVVVHGNLPFTNDVVPGRSCRIAEPNEQLPQGTFLSGDVIVPEGGCPLIYYRGRIPGAVIYDDRTKNPLPPTANDGCDVTGPSALSNCNFAVVAQGTPVPSQYLAHWVFNVEPL